ncbi:hypothetical protein AU252_12870 [Pseudarthrobacter sulfonivorans]|uniref:Uncharacterized protein n=1 Tax=Pseudarthrobacter sulfonivorans TaxID=121292 RepID=A0A0U3GRW0_9MICC|nr:hypothetical protein AU252_12870 [Pseudarthrobacter sulfonivorans]
MVASNFRQGSAAVDRRSREYLLAGLPIGNGVAECEGVAAGIMAGDQNAGIALGPGYLPKRGFCIVEQLVESTRLGNVDFQMLGGLSAHDEQLPFQDEGPPNVPTLIIEGVMCSWIKSM